ncbi:unnamed protein product [Ectocarpus sp. CCAP 1310/34]|nr:unnamed protein product [Ectocarpus sp. CCAP 1310/34]
MGADLLLVCFDRAPLVPAIKGREQSGRPDKIGGCALSLDPTSTDAIPPSQYQSCLRDNQKAARDGIAAHLAMDILDKRWTGYCTPNGVVAFYGVGGEAGLRTSDAANPAVSSGGGVQGGPATSPEIPAPVGSVENSTVRSGGDGTEEGGVPTVAEEDPLLHYRRGADRSVQRERGPNIGEAELSLVHFIVWAKNGEGAVEVTVQKVVGGDPKYIWVNRVFAAIRASGTATNLRGPRRTPVSRVGFPTTMRRYAFSSLSTYLLAGCDFLPAIPGLPFGTMWALALKSVRTEGVFRTSIFVREGGVWGVKIDECIKLLATIFYFKYEAVFARGGQEPGWILRMVDGDVAHYVDVIRLLILRRTSKWATSTCPAFESMRQKSERGRQVLGYWQDGYLEVVPVRDFNGKGWGVDPKEGGTSSGHMTAETACYGCLRILSLAPTTTRKRRNVSANRPRAAAQAAARQQAAASQQADAPDGSRGTEAKDEEKENEARDEIPEWESDESAYSDAFSDWGSDMSNGGPDVGWGNAEGVEGPWGATGADWF